MKKFGILAFATAAMVMTAGAISANPWYARGEFNGWAGTAHELVESGVGTGIFVVNITGLTANQASLFKVTDDTWTTSFPSNDSRFVADGAGNVTISLDTNSAGDGFSPDTNRVLTTPVFPATTYTAVGDWQGWDPASVSTVMVDQGAGIYTLNATIATAGAHEYKVALDGAWTTQITATGLATDGPTVPFTSVAANEDWVFTVDTANNTIKAELVPPSSVSDWMLLDY